MLILSILQRNADNQFISQIANAKEHLGDQPLTDEIAKQVGEPKYGNELAKLDKATDTTPPAEEKSFGDKAREVVGEVAESAIKGVLGISEAHAADMPIMHRQPENQQDSDMVKTGYQSENNHRHSEQQNQAEKDRSGSVKGEKTQAEKQDIAIDDKLNPKTSAWAFRDHENLKDLDDKGLVDKPIVGQEEKIKTNDNIKTSYDKENHTLNLSEKDIVKIMKVVATEADPRVKGEEFNKQTDAILDTILNRIALANGNVDAVLNKKWAFSAINNPADKKAYGTADNVPESRITQRHRDEVIAHLQRRASGEESSIGTSVNYANPDQLKNASPTTRKWVEEVVKQAEKSGHVYGTGKMKHYHGQASGERPAPKFGVSIPRKYGNEEKK